MKQHDYSEPGAYFITVCTKNKAHILSRIVVDLPSSVGRDALIPPRVQLLPAGKIVDNLIRRTETVYDNVTVDAYVIMPNHIHMIVSMFYDNEKDNNISVTDVVRIFKSLTTRLCKVGPVIFQRSFYDHIIRNDTDYSRILNYINNNPSKWEEDSLYNSAKTVTVL